MIKINLIPAEYPARQRAQVQSARIAAGVAAAALVAVLITIGHVRGALNAEKMLRQKQQLLVTYQDKVAKVRELESAKSSVEGHLNAIESLLAGRLYYTNFIGDLLETLPQSVWLSSLNTTLRPENGSIEFNVSAHALSAEAFAQWYARLESGGRFSAPKLNGALNIENDKGAEACNFSLNGLYSQPAK